MKHYKHRGFPKDFNNWPILNKRRDEVLCAILFVVAIVLIILIGVVLA